MSSYLNIYLVPKKEKCEKQEPLLFASYSRNTDVYQYFETINPTFVGIDEIHYSELTNDKLQEVKNEIKEDLETFERKHKHKLQVLKYAINKPSEDYIQELAEEKEYIHELKITYNTIDSLVDILSEINDGYTDFEKVLVNVG